MSNIRLLYQIEAYEIKFKDQKYSVMKYWSITTKKNEYAVFNETGEEIPENKTRDAIIDEFIRFNSGVYQ